VSQDSLMIVAHTFHFPPHRDTSVQEARAEKKRAGLDAILWEYSRSYSAPSSLSLPWTIALTAESQDAGKMLATNLSRALSTTIDEDGRGRVTENGNELETGSCLESRLSAAASLLLTTDYCCKASVDNSMSSIYAMGSALEVGLDKVQKAFNFPADQSSDEVVSDLDAERVKAISELREALDSLKAEVVASCAKQELKT
jgi:hypothetical protein